nr:hypothetical protein [Tanacetum cinerariifolium]
MPQESEAAAPRPALPMRLTRLRVKNFRSIADIDIPLSPLTVLVGPNGSGKSNVVDALRFVRDVFSYNLGRALAEKERQGIENIQKWETENQAITIGITIEFVDEPYSVVEYDFSFQRLSDDTIGVVTECLVISPEFGVPLKIIKNHLGLTIETDALEPKSGGYIFPRPYPFRMNHQKLKGLLSSFGAWSYNGNEQIYKEWKRIVDRVEKALPLLLFYTLNPGNENLRLPQNMVRSVPLDEKGSNLLAALHRFIEEPEANIHPGALAVLASVLDEASLRSQSAGFGAQASLHPRRAAAHGRLAAPNHPQQRRLMPTLQLLVEGEGDMQAAPVLLRRLLHEEHQRYDWQVDPKHTMKVWGLHKLRQNLPKFIEHLRGKSCDGAMILLDLEDQLPCQEAPALAEEIAALQSLPFPVVIVFACREYEAWFLAGIAS